MPENNSTRHKSSVALILIDVINHFGFPDGDQILKNDLPMPDRLAKLQQRCRRAGRPCCIVCTAHDAGMRNFSLYVPSDCSAARRVRGESRRKQSKA
jgi:nicotinamidase-related amidase